MRDSRRDRTRTTASALALWTLAATISACASGGVPHVPEAGDRIAGELRVRLVFDASADLDLYVTGPRLETVYFANTPSRIGGALDRDVRCDERDSVRIETVRFHDAPAGRYNVGVDFPERCRLTSDTARFLVEIEGEGLAERREGEIRYGAFQSQVIQFDYRPTAGPALTGIGER